MNFRKKFLFEDKYLYDIDLNMFVILYVFHALRLI